MKSTYNQLHNYFEIFSTDNHYTIRAFIHDLKNIIFALSNYMYFQDYDKVQQKIDDLCDMVQNMENKNYTGIYCIDKLIAYKVKIMDKLHIKFDVINNAYTFNKIDNLDLCVILGNSLDNAIEACLKITDVKNRYVNLSFTSGENFLEINVCNSINSNLPIDFNTTKPNKKYHGFGINNIKTVLQKYNGEFHTDQFDNYFTVSMKLYF